MRRGRRLLYNTLLLTLASMFMRAVAVSFQVYLAGVIGPAGVGLFGLIASAQMLALTVAVSGIRFAATRLVSEELGRENPRSVPQVMGRCMTHALCFGLLASGLLFFGAPFIGRVWIGDMRAVLSLRILSVSLPFAAVFASLNGYFIAVSRVIKSAGVSVFEQVLRISFAAALFVLRAPDDLETALATVVIGSVAAETVSSLLLFGLYLGDKRGLSKEGASGRALTRRLLRISMPLAASTYARSGLNTLQHMLVPRGLRRGGVTGDEALASYGMVHGMALPVILFPSAVFYAAAELIVPELTAAQVRGDQARISYLVSKLLRFSLYVSIGIGGLFLAFSRELGQVIYPHTPGVGPYIHIFAFLMPIIFLDAITDGMLKGLGQQVYSMGVNIADSLLSVALVYLLLPIFAVGGFIFMVFFTECFNFFFSLRRVAQIAAIRLAVSDILKPVLSAGAAIQVVPLILRMLGVPLSASVVSLVLHFLLTGGVYGLMLFLLGCVTRQDLRWVRRLVRDG